MGTLSEVGSELLGAKMRLSERDRSWGRSAGQEGQMVRDEGLHLN